MNRTAIDMLIESIEKDIRRTEVLTMNALLGNMLQTERLREYRTRLTQAQFYKRREADLYA